MAEEGPGEAWQWDPTLYQGSAQHYSRGRLAYPAALVSALVGELGLDGSQRLLDVGCGPGSLTRALAPYVRHAVGVDADPDMLAVARAASPAGGHPDVEWRLLRAEELPADLGLVDVVTFAQSFHWFDRPRVAAAARGMLAPGGAVVLVSATTHRGDASTDPLKHPRPPHDEIGALVGRYLGSQRRAGQGRLPGGTPSGEDDIFRAAGLHGPRRLELATATVVTRTADDVVAAVHSLSSAAPHLFGDQRESFERDLRDLLRATSPSGLFSERTRDVAADVWWLQPPPAPPAT